MKQRPAAGTIPIIIGLSLLIIAAGMLLADIIEQPAVPLEISNNH